MGSHWRLLALGHFQKDHSDRGAAGRLEEKKTGVGTASLEAIIET